MTAVRSSSSTLASTTSAPARRKTSTTVTTSISSVPSAIGTRTRFAFAAAVAERASATKRAFEAITTSAAKTDLVIAGMVESDSKEQQCGTQHLLRLRGTRQNELAACKTLALSSSGVRICALWLCARRRALKSSTNHRSKTTAAENCIGFASSGWLHAAAQYRSKLVPSTPPHR